MFGAEFEASKAARLCPPGVAIRADSSERVSGVPGLLAGLGAEVINTPLETGDYLVCGRVLVERKTAADFAQSLYSGRLFDQLKRMKYAAQAVLLVIEGEKWYFSQIRPKSLRTAFLSVLVSWNMPVVFTKDPEGTAALLAELGEKESRHKRFFSAPRLFHRHRAKAVSSIKEARIRLVAEIPGVGFKLALKLMAKFQGVRALAEAPEAEIAAVYGIGKRKAARILWALKEPSRKYYACEMKIE